MKTKLLSLRWLIMLIFSVSALVVTAQPYPNSGDYEVCLNSTEPYGVELTVGSTYNWTIIPLVGGGGTITAGVTPNLISVNWTSSGTATLQLVEETSLGCSVTVSIVVTVNPNPTVIAANDGPLCVGSELNLTATPSGGTGPYTYTWTGPNGFTSTLQNPTVAVVAVADAGEYTVIVTDASSISCTGTGATTVVINPNPTVTAANDGPLCVGSELNLTATPSGGTGPYTYSWTGPNGFTSTLQNPTVAIVAVADAGEYTVIVTDASSTACTGTNVTTVVVNPNPTVIAANNGPLCVGSELNLTATPSGGTGPYTYSWTGPNGFTSTLQNPIVASVVIADAGEYTVIVTDDSATSCTGTDATTLVVNPNPTTSTIWHN